MKEFSPDELMQQSGMLYAYARPRVGDAHTAEDLVQEVVVAAWQRRASFDGRAKLSTWLVGIMRFKIIDHYRARKRTPTSRAVESPEGAEWGEDSLDRLFDSRGSWRIDPHSGMDDFARTPSDEAERRDMLRMVLECLEGLPARLRLLFSLREIDGLPVAEAAAAAGVTHGSAAVLLTRARHQLRACLQRRDLSP